MKLGNWADDPCYYVSVVDGDRYGLLAGPFREHQEALDLVSIAKEEAEKANDKARWYAFGTCKTPNGYRNGILNQQIGERIGRVI